MYEKIGNIILLLALGMVAACGLCYEYLISTYAGYTLGAAFKEVFLIITLMMFAMGVGSFITQKFKNNLLVWFLVLEMSIALVGGTSILFISWGNAIASYLPEILTQFIFGGNWKEITKTPLFQSFLFDDYLIEIINWLPYILAFLIGIMIGMEIPFVARILKGRRVSLEKSISNTLGIDYVGSLFGGLAWVFVFILIPLTKAAFILGSINGIVGFICIMFFAKELKARKTFILSSVNFLVVALLVFGFSQAGNW